MGEPAKVWAIEDDPGCRFLYEEVLGPRYALTVFTRLAAFRAAIDQAPEAPALIVADLCLPDGMFLQILQSKSQNTRPTEIPLIVVSSIGGEAELHACFDYGATDYLVKPFNKNELLVKVERCIAHAKARSHQVTIDPTTMTIVTNSGKASVPLTARELQIVTLLHAEMPRPIAREQIVNVVWNKTTVSPKTLDVHLFNLRQKLLPLGLAIEYLPTCHFQLKSVRGA